MKKRLLMGLGMILSLWFQLHAQTYINVGSNQPAMLLANAGIDQLICQGDSIQIGGFPAATGGTAAYNYTWSNASSLSGGALSNPMAGPNVTTSYLLTVTDSRNCTALDTITVTVDTCLGIGQPEISQEVMIYPNPNKGVIHIRMGNFTLSHAVVQVTDLNGKLISRIALGDLKKGTERSLDLSALAKGVYILRISSDQPVISRRIIIE